MNHTAFMCFAETGASLRCDVEHGRDLESFALMRSPSVSPSNHSMTR